METQTCGNCKFFYRHYIKYTVDFYSPIDFGHCTEPRLKNRCIHDKACSRWQENKEN